MLLGTQKVAARVSGLPDHKALSFFLLSGKLQVPLRLQAVLPRDNPWPKRVSGGLNDQQPRAELLSQPCSIRLQHLDVVEYDFGGCCQRYCEHKAHGAPEPPPEKQRDCYRQGIQLQAISQKHGINQVERNDVER